MKKYVLKAVLLFSLASCSWASADYDISSIPADVFKLKVGLSLGSSYRDFLFLLGQPKDEKRYYSRRYRQRVVALQYNGLSTLIVGDLINHITLTSRAFGLPNGVRVGDKKDKVFHLLGRARLEQIKSQQLARYYVRNPRNFFTEEFLFIYFKNNRVTKIVLWYPVQRR